MAAEDECPMATFSKLFRLRVRGSPAERGSEFGVRIFFLNFFFQLWVQDPLCEEMLTTSTTFYSASCSHRRKLLVVQIISSSLVHVQGITRTAISCLKLLWHSEILATARHTGRCRTCTECLFHIIIQCAICNTREWECRWKQ